MKQLPKPIDVMKMMHQYISDAYNELATKETGIIQFILIEKGEKINCFFKADGENLLFSEGISDNYDVSLESSLSDWLALADKRLNPLVGILLRRLKFKGDVSCFKRIIPVEMYKVDLTPYTDSINTFELTPLKEWRTPKKVLLLDSSPRGTKGYTKLYCDSIEGFLLEKDVEVNHILLSKYKINPCLGCLQCWIKNDGECIIQDDVKELYKLYEEADLIIFAFPLYAYGVPGILKNFMDRGVMRQYPYFEKGISEIRHPRREKNNKAFVVFSICGFPGSDQFNSVKHFFKLYSHSSHSPLIAEIYRPGGIFLLQNPFNYTKLMKFMGALQIATHEIVDYGKIRSKTQQKLNVKLDESVFLKSTNKYWDNLYKNKNTDY